MTTTRLLTLISGFCLAAAVQAQVYKFVDKDGIINYTTEKPVGQNDVQVLRFPCYASDPKCRGVNWENVPLNLQSFVDVIDNESRRHGVDASLMRAIIHAESAFQADAVSPKGAQGLMQLMPFNSERYGITDPFEPAQNIAGGARHLAELQQQFGSDTDRVVAAYNAGAGAVQRYDGIPPYDETREYVRRVNILYRRYRAGQ